MANDNDVEYYEPGAPKPEGYEEFEKWMLHSAGEYLEVLCKRDHTKSAFFDMNRFLLTKIQSHQVRYIADMDDEDKAGLSFATLMLAAMNEALSGSPIYEDHILVDQVIEQFTRLLAKSGSLRLPTGKHDGD